MKGIWCRDLCSYTSLRIPTIKKKIKNKKIKKNKSSNNSSTLEKKIKKIDNSQI
jgi:hypothetical protein